MRKYVNGKLFDMTENDKMRMSKNRMSRANKPTSDSVFANRINELENTVKELEAKLAELKQQ